MRSMLLVGKINTILIDINKYFSNYFKVQVASDDADQLPGFIKAVDPEIVILCLSGMYEGGHEKIFLTLSKQFPNIPVITVGIKQERDKFLKYYEGGQFTNILRPVENTVILDAIAERLFTTSDHIIKEAQGLVSSSGKKRILCVDDDGTMLRSLKSMLEDEYEVFLAPSGMKAMTSMGKNRPDIVLLDYEMPVCDGKQTLEMIRGDEDLAELPVIFLTSVNDAGHIRQVLALKPQGYLLKPPVREKLKEEIARVLDASLV